MGMESVGMSSKCQLLNNLLNTSVHGEKYGHECQMSISLSFSLSLSSNSWLFHCGNLLYTATCYLCPFHVVNIPCLSGLSRNGGGNHLLGRGPKEMGPSSKGAPPFKYHVNTGPVNHVSIHVALPHHHHPREAPRSPWNLHHHRLMRQRPDQHHYHHQAQSSSQAMAGTEYITDPSWCREDPRYHMHNQQP